jgi:hypothetical protein
MLLTVCSESDVRQRSNDVRLDDGAVARTVVRRPIFAEFDLVRRDDEMGATQIPPRRTAYLDGTTGFDLKAKSTVARVDRFGSG